MSKHSEKTKVYIRFFADNPLSTIDDLVKHLGLSTREDRLGKRKVRHTIGDLVYRDILQANSIGQTKHKAYMLTVHGREVVNSYHTPIPSQPTRNLVAEKDVLDSATISKIIPKENDVKAPPTPTANDKTRKVVSGAELTVDEAIKRFVALAETDLKRAVIELGKQFIRVRDDLRNLRNGLVDSQGRNQNNSQGD